VYYIMHVSDVFHIICINMISEHSQSQYAIKQFIIINYVSKHQLSHIIDSSHTTPTTHVNRGSKLLKLIGWRNYPCFRWVQSIPGTTAQMPGVEPSCTARYYSNSKTVTVWDVSRPREPYSGTLSQLHNLYPKST